MLINHNKQSSRSREAWDEAPRVAPVQWRRACSSEENLYRGGKRNEKEIRTRNLSRCHPATPSGSELEFVQISCIWLVSSNARGARAFVCVVFVFVYIKHWDRESSTEVSTPPQECPRRRDRLSIDRSSIRPYGRCRSATRTCLPWVLELMDPCGKYL